jgi:hypothetical protein
MWYFFLHAKYCITQYKCTNCQKVNETNDGSSIMVNVLLSRAHQNKLGHMAPKQKRLFWLTSGVTNFKQHQGSKPSHQLEL